MFNARNGFGPLYSQYLKFNIGLLVMTKEKPKFVSTSSTTKEYIHSTTGIEFVLIPGGNCQMGSNYITRERPIHKVKVDSFLLAKYPVTNKLYLAFAQQFREHVPQWMEEIRWFNIKIDTRKLYRIQGLTDENNPVVGVSWHNAYAFCSHYGFSLPTEAQWDYACRAGSSKDYYWGDTVDGDYLWYHDNSNGTTHKVGQKKPNAFGLYDMNGNVWEWCADWFQLYYDRKRPSDNPTGPEEGSQRVVRGGSWQDFDWCSRLSNRTRHSPIRRKATFGFRPCFSI